MDLTAALPGLATDQLGSLLVGLRPEEITLVPPGAQRDREDPSARLAVLERLEPLGPHRLALSASLASIIVCGGPPLVIERAEVAN